MQGAGSPAWAHRPAGGSEAGLGLWAHLPQALCSLLRRDASVSFKAKGNSLVSVLACNLLMAAYEEDENWPEIFVKVSGLSQAITLGEGGRGPRLGWGNCWTIRE